MSFQVHDGNHDNKFAAHLVDHAERKPACLTAARPLRKRRPSVWVHSHALESLEHLIRELKAEARALTIAIRDRILDFEQSRFKYSELHFA